MYHIFDYLNGIYDIPGLGMFQYLSFRSVMAIICSLLMGIVFGRKIIDILQKKQVGEVVRNLGLEGQIKKTGTPTMGGVIIIASILVPTLLFCDLSNIYIQLMILSTVWLGFIGFLDDYIKVFKHNKDGLKGRFKVLGQVVLGLIVGSVMWFNSDIVVRESSLGDRTEIVQDAGSFNVKSTKTTTPFFKDNEFDYRQMIPIEGELGDTLTWILYVLVATFIITAVSNGANLTDGLDGLAAGVSASIVMVLGVLAYLSGNIIYADYLNIMHIPFSGELVVFAGALIGALIGFLWYNSYPAQVFMGDTGSLAIGGIIAVFALLIRKELLLPILCGIFFVESLSVIMQVTYFKYTKNKYGEGRRFILMAPLHHHYQKQGHHEMKIVMRFWIIQLLLAAIALVTLKIR